MSAPDYKSMTDQERMTALWAHSLQVERLKARRKVLKDNPPDDQTASQWADELNAVAEELRGVRAELKRLWKEVRE